jgi:hypothetical protein
MRIRIRVRKMIRSTAYFVVHFENRIRIEVIHFVIRSAYPENLIFFQPDSDLHIVLVAMIFVAGPAGPLPEGPARHLPGQVPGQRERRAEQRRLRHRGGRPLGRTRRSAPLPADPLRALRTGGA